MPPRLQSECRNRLLTLLPSADFAALAPRLTHAALNRGDILLAADAAITDVYFPQNGVISIVAASPEGRRVEAGLFGFEGFGPVSAVLGSTRVVHEITVQIPGDALHVERGSLVEAAASSPALNSLLLRYVQVMSVQTAFTALSNAVHSIDERLARWLLMCHDRCSGDDLPLTHEFMSLMLAVRRPSVTTSLHVLEGHRLIQAKRGSVTVRDRRGLETFAGNAYGRPEAEYQSLMGAAPRRDAPGPALPADATDRTGSDAPPRRRDEAAG